MTPAIEFLNHFGQALLARLGPLSLELAALALAVWLLIALLRIKSPVLRHLFWGVVLIKPLASFLVASPISPYGYIPSPPAPDAQPVVPTPTQVPPLAVAPVAAGPLAPSPQPAAPGLDAHGLLALLWLAFVGLWALRFFSGWSIVFFIRQTASEKFNGPLREALLVAQRALRVRRRVRIAVSDLAQGPMLTGFIRPVIIVPSHIQRALTPEQLHLILLHELAHIRRADNLTLYVQRFFEAVLFFHPAVWICGKLMRREAERACDDAVVAAGCDPDLYADSLARVAEFRHALSGRLLLSACAAAESDLERRVRRLLRGQVQRASRRAWAVGLAGLAAVALLGLPTGAVQTVAPQEPLAMDAPVDFADPNLEAVIREVVGKPAGPLLARDVRRIWVLHAPNRGIERLDGVEHLTSAEVLDFRRNQIADLSPLSQLTQLTQLYLAHNRIADIAPLQNLHDLVGLKLDHNQIADISPLRSLQALREIRLDANRVEDISALAELPRLFYLKANDNRIAAVAPLRAAANLARLDLRDNRIADISALVGNPAIGAGDIVAVAGNAADLADAMALLEARGVRAAPVEPRYSGSGEFTDQLSYFLVDPDVGKPTFTKHHFRHERLASIVTNPAGTNSERFVVIGVELGIGAATALTEEEAARVDRTLEPYAMRMVSVITKILRSKTIDQLEGNALGHLQTEIRDELNRSFVAATLEQALAPKELVLQEVVLTNIVIQ